MPNLTKLEGYNRTQDVPTERKEARGSEVKIRRQQPKGRSYCSIGRNSFQGEVWSELWREGMPGRLNGWALVQVGSTQKRCRLAKRHVVLLDCLSSTVVKSDRSIDRPTCRPAMLNHQDGPASSSNRKPVLKAEFEGGHRRGRHHGCLRGVDSPSSSPRRHVACAQHPSRSVRPGPERTWGQSVSPTD